MGTRTTRTREQAIAWCTLILVGAACSFTCSSGRLNRVSKVPFFEGPVHQDHPSLLFASTVPSGESHILPSENGNKGGKQEANFILPVFPLRKSVRMPSEALTLNLYEERYLALSEYVLTREPRRFGALYCSNKPQFVKDGVGPIVPMVDHGDVGVVCNVLYDEQAVVPISPENDGLRRRIKLQGLAVGRFRIEKVLHNGYGGGFSCDRDKHVIHLPFILVEASWFNDSHIVPGSEEEMRVIELEAKLFTSIFRKEGTMDKVAMELWGELVCDDEPGCGDECNLLSGKFAPLLPSHLRKAVGGGANSTQTRDSTITELALYSGVGDSVNSVEGRRRELSSFALSAIVSPEKSVDDALRLLRSRSTYERLQQAYYEFKKSRSLLSNIKLLL